MDRWVRWGLLGVVAVGLGRAGDSPPLEPLALYDGERKPAEQGWTLSGEWHTLKEPLKRGGPYRYCLATIGFIGSAAAARVDLSVPLAELTPAHREQLRGWRLGVGVELPHTTVLELRTADADDGTQVVAHVVGTQVELGVKAKDQPFVASVSRALKAAPSSVWLEWDGRRCSLRVDRPDGEPLATFEPERGPERPLVDSVEFALSELGESEHAILRDPTLLPRLQ